MATIIGKAGGWLLDKVNDVMANEIVSQISTSQLNRLWILPLVLRKMNGTGGMTKDDSMDSSSDKYNQAITSTNPSGYNNDKIYTYTNPVRDLVRSTKNPDSVIINLDKVPDTGVTNIKKNKSKNYPQKLKEMAGVTGDSIFQTYKPKKNEIIIMNITTNPYTCITLQNRPPEIDIDPQSTWVEVKSMGRNVPFMMYTGASDTLSFDISWFSNQPERRDDVITKCRLLESWTKSDGYNAAPPVLKIKWGVSDIFSSAYFILYSAKYTLSNFQDSCVNDPNSGFVFKNTNDITSNDTSITGYNKPYIISNPAESRNKFQNLGLFPAMAVQHLVFKRVSQENIDYSMIDYAHHYVGLMGYTFAPVEK